MADHSVDAPDWSKIPAPHDDGATRHLPGMALPHVALQATDGTRVIQHRADLARLLVDELATDLVPGRQIADRR